MSAAPRLTQHQLNRRLLLARVWLSMALALWPAQALLAECVAPLWRARVVGMREFCLRLIFLSAVNRVGPLVRTARGYGPRQHRRAGAMRAAYGCALLRAISGHGLRAQLEALLNVLRNLEAIIARLARRLRKGLRPLLAFTLVREMLLAIAPLQGAPAPLTDSS